MKKIRILSLDGGGIRGIIPGVILSYIEGELQRKTNSDKKIGDFFDFIAGTSTGGILACAYLLPDENGKAKYSAQNALDFYLKDGEAIFNRSFGKKITSVFGLADEKFSAAELEKNLNLFFDDALLASLIKPCLITAYEITSRKAYFFNSANAQDPIYNFKVRDVTRATSAAPTYFEPTQIKSMNGQLFSFIDGGVFANNPALCAYAEARKMHFHQLLNIDNKPNTPSVKDMMIVSIGTGTVNKPYYFKDFENAGELKWLNPIIDILMSGNAETVDYQLMQMYSTLDYIDQSDYFRLEPALREAAPDMDLASPKNMENLKQAGLWYIDENKNMIDVMINKIIENE